MNASSQPDTAVIQLHSTLSKTKAPFLPRTAGKPTLYVCGPTVYDDAHLGHARCYVTWDILFRLLRFVYGEANVTYARNVTDVDDKILNRAKAEGIAFSELAERYLARFQEDMAALHVLAPTVEPKATQHIEAMQAMIHRLLAKGLAYTTPDGTVYFEVSQQPDYGKLSGRKQEDMQAGARVDVDPHKRGAGDFALWKPCHTPDEPGWNDITASEPPLAKGRPGWHIECSAMIHSVFGGQPIDIHAGGQDLIFPHHENEIAQSEGCCGTDTFVGIWMHNGFVNVSGEKMSKSLGNFSTIRGLLSQYSANAIRYFILSQKYDKPIDFTEEALTAAENWVKKAEKTIREFLAAFPLKHWDKAAFDAQQLSSSRVMDAVAQTLADDLNSPRALAELGGFLKAFKPLVEKRRQSETVSPELLMEAVLAWNHLYTLASLLGLDFSGAFQQLAEKAELSLFEWLDSQPDAKKALHTLAATNLESPGLDSTGTTEPDALLEQLIQARTEAKKAKDWATADAIRNGLEAMGIQLKDTREGTTYTLAEPPVSAVRS